jgi:membrane-associated phospholipid phosphatase
MKVHLPFRYRPLNDPDLGLRLPFGVDPVSLNHFSSFPSGHAMLFFALSVPLWMRSRWLGAAAAGWTLLAICLPLPYLGDPWASDIFAGAVVGAWRSCSYCADLSTPRDCPIEWCVSVQRIPRRSTPLRGWSPLSSGTTAACRSAHAKLRL